jgi:predicted RNA-binding Zn ribbon-like protein
MLIINLVLSMEFQLVAGNAALDFTNTLDWRYDPERLIELLPDYSRFLAFCQQAGVITPQEARHLVNRTSEPLAKRALGQVLDLRETLYVLFLCAVRGERPSNQIMKKLNVFLDEATSVNPLSWDNGRFLRVRSKQANSPMEPLWRILDAGVELLSSADVDKVRECGEETCKWLFLDTSRNGARRWCDMRICGNRAKAKRYYSRTRQELAGSGS